jgi:uncharacterized membrane protein YedE/YeeE
MRQVATAFVCGLLFGIGLIVSQMSNPAKVIGFLDITGQWDPSLAFVMAGAVAVFALGYRLTLRRSAPLLDKSFALPGKTNVDKALISGSLLFGLGWGLAGLCPGPAIVSSSFGDPRILMFIVAMLSGMAIVRMIRQRTRG